MQMQFIDLYHVNKTYQYIEFSYHLVEENGYQYISSIMLH